MNVPIKDKTNKLDTEDIVLYGANRQRLRYTYITRAAKYLTILVAA